MRTDAGTIMVVLSFWIETPDAVVAAGRLPGDDVGAQVRHGSDRAVREADEVAVLALEEVGDGAAVEETVKLGVAKPRPKPWAAEEDALIRAGQPVPGLSETAWASPYPNPSSTAPTTRE